MTEEQKKKCEEIYNSHIDFSHKIYAAILFLPKFVWVKITILLAEVFNKDITEKEAEEIFDNINKNRQYSALNPINQSNYKDTFWRIANYFDNGNKEANKINKINNFIENTAKEKIMSNNDELTLNLLIIGQTGVGKSSLINALVGKEIEKMGVGKPKITKGIFNYEAEVDGKKVIIHDSWGLEIGADEEWEKIIKNALKERSADKDIKDWFHSVTYCIQSGGLKIQDFDIKMIKLFMDKKYNVIVALTKADQIGTAKREEFINIIKEEVKKATEKDITVIPLSADPMQLDHMTEKPKPFGLEEYKAAILISWEKIFMDRMPLHIIEKLKEDIINAKSNAPRKGKDKELSYKIQEYFSNLLNTNIQKYVRENIEKYYKITTDILISSKNINLSNRKLDLNFYSELDGGGTIEFWTGIFGDLEYFEVVDRIKLILLAPLAIPMGILEFGIIKPLEFLLHIMEKGDKIEEFINDVIKEYIKKIDTEEFESEIRKIIINALKKAQTNIRLSVNGFRENYFDNESNNNENKINNVVENTAKEKIMTKEEQKKKCEEIINSYEEKYNKDFEEALTNISNIPEIPDMPESEIKTVKKYISTLLFWYDKSDSTRSLHLEPIPKYEAKAKFYEFFAKTKDKTVENIIDLTVDLSEVFGNGMTREEAEKLLFTKKSVEIDGTLSYLNIFAGATEKFREIMKLYEKGILECENYLKYMEEEICTIKNIGEAIANYFENYFEKEKIMSNNDELTLNLLILGKTGTGKSSLVNALVGKEVAKVGDAEPETEDIYPYYAEIDRKKIIIHDSWGMEVGKEKIWDDIINKKLKEKGIDKDIKDWFHSVTYCIQAGGNRIEDFDAKIITKFIKDKYNVIVALTKAEQMGKEDREKFTEKIKERIKKEIEKEDAKNDININDIIVVSVSASPKKLDYMTEAPKPYGLEEYKAAILISWREIFINRIPIHIIEKLKKDIINAKSKAPREGKDLEKLAKEIQKYFINVVKEKVQNHVKDNFEKYYKITEDILYASKTIDISNLNMYGSIDDTTYIFSAFDFDSSVLESIGNIVLMLLFAPLTIVSGLLDLISLIAFNIKKSDKINEFINEVSQKIIDKISEEEFESEIRKIIINALNEIDKKIIKLN